MDDFKPILRRYNDINEIFDPIRKKYVAFTPEEMVRQYIIDYLIRKKDIPRACISVEKYILLNKLSRRIDIAVYNRELKVSLLIECKAPEIELTQNVLDQVLRYNTELNARYIAITNGKEIICFKLDKKISEPLFFNDFPDFNALNSN